MKTIRIFLTGLVAAGCMICSSFAAPTKEGSQGLEIARQLNQAFIEVADKVSPAVVVVEVTEKPQSFNRNQLDEDNPFWDMFPPELRKRFFDENGQPRGNQNQPRQRRQQQRPSGRGSGIVITE